MGNSKKEIVCYSTDASRLYGRIDQVYYPKTIDELQRIIKSSNLDIIPRGAGSGLVGGTIPKDSIVIDTCNMKKIFNLNLSKKTVQVESGVTLKELNEKLNSQGYEFPIDPSNQGIGTIGGMIATNSSGSRQLRFGNTKDWIEGVEFINGRGELIKTSKADLGDVCGMEGITGIIVIAKLRIISNIKKSFSLFQSDNIDEVFSVARRLKSEKDVLMLELFPSYVSKILNLPEKYNLIVEFGSDRGKIKDEEYKILFRNHERAYYSLSKEGYYNQEDPKFFFDKLREFILYLEQNQIPYIGYIGSGVIQPFFKDNEKKKREDTINFTKRLNGKFGKFGIGLTRKHLIESFELKLISRVKQRHDPMNRMNKGKIIDEISQAKRIESITGSELKEIRPNLGEEKSAVDFLKEINFNEKDSLENKTKRNIVLEKESSSFPELEQNKKIIRDFVNKAVIEDKRISEKINSMNSNKEVEMLLKDYEETYDSELNFDKKKIIEDYAKNVPREIVRSEILQENLDKREPVFERHKPVVDYKEIQKIMTNRSNIQQSTFNKDVQERKYPVQKEQLNEKINENKSRLTTDEEKDIINKIMTNKFGKGFSNFKQEKNGN